MPIEAPLSTAHSLANQEPADLELLTVAEVAVMLKVTKSWMYERTRVSPHHVDSLPFVKLGKYLRFGRPAVLAFVERQRCSASRTNR